MTRQTIYFEAPPLQYSICVGTFFLPAILLFTRPHHPVDASPTVCSLSAYTHGNAHTRARACGLYGLGFCSDCEFMKSWRLYPPPTRLTRSVLYSRLSKGTPLKSSRRRDGTVHLYTVGKHEESKNILTYLHWKTVRTGERRIKSYL